MEKIKCLVTAGPTREYFDPVRYISNPSSGKMGYAVAEAARNKGWDVSLISGPVDLPDISGIKTVRVTSAQEMLEQTRLFFKNCDILIMSAAVCDVRPKRALKEKVKKDDIDLSPALERTPDILLTLSKEKKNQVLVGFAAETSNVLEYAKKKLAQKNLDCIVANLVGGSSGGFASDENKIDLILRSGEIIDFNPAKKTALASMLIDFLAIRFFNR